MIDRLETQTPDVAQENIRKVMELFPDCVTEVEEGGRTRLAIDFDALKRDLSDAAIAGEREIRIHLAGQVEGQGAC